MRSLHKPHKLFLFFFLLALTSSSYAHFGEAITRIIILEEQPTQDHSLTLNVRTPAPLVLLPSNWRGIDSKQEILFTNLKDKLTGNFYYLNPAYINEHKSEFENKLLEQFYLVDASGKKLGFSFNKIKISNYHERQSFNHLEHAKKALKGAMFPEEKIELFDAVIDFSVTFHEISMSDQVTLISSAGENFKATDWLVNVVRYPESMERANLTIPGTLSEGIVLSDPKSSFGNFFVMGVKHIFEGNDHMLFILLMTLSCTTLVMFMKNVTGFTVGHMITLSLGATLSTLDQPWFIPMIELAIALTILYMAIMNFSKRDESHWFVTFFIGLIHGFGFSFMLRGIFEQSKGFDWVPLFSFNLGIETGQIILYGLYALILLILERYKIFNDIFSRKSLVIVSAGITLFWIYERTLQLIETL